MAEIGAASKYSRHCNIRKMVFSYPAHPGGLAGSLLTQSKTPPSVDSITYPLMSLLFTDASKLMLLPLAQGQNASPFFVVWVNTPLSIDTYFKHLKASSHKKLLYLRMKFMHLLMIPTIHGHNEDYRR